MRNLAIRTQPDPHPEMSDMNKKVAACPKSNPWFMSHRDDGSLEWKPSSHKNRCEQKLIFIT